MHEGADLGGRIQRVPDIELTDAFHELRIEFVLDGFLHEQAARRRATFTVQAVDHEHDRVQRAIEIGILEHDDRVLAAELEMHALQRVRALPHDVAAGHRFADERDRLDRRVLGQ